VESDLMTNHCPFWKRNSNQSQADRYSSRSEHCLFVMREGPNSRGDAKVTRRNNYV